MSRRVITPPAEPGVVKYKYVECEDLRRIFKMEKTLCFGLQDSKYAKEIYPYTLPISLKEYPGVKEKLEKLGKKYKVEKFLFGDSIYLKLKKLSEKQKDELYEKGFKYVFVVFSLSGICERVLDEKKYMNFQVEVLKKVGDFGRNVKAPKDDESFSSDSE